MRKFLFDRSFDEAESGDKKPILVAPSVTPEFDKEALKNQAFESGYARGFQEGLASAEQQKESATIQNIRQILETVGHHSEELENQRHAITAAAAQMTLQVVGKLFPLFQKKLGVFEVESFIEQILKDKEPGSFKIVAHPEICKLLQEKLHQSPEKSVIVFEGDAGLGFGDFRAFWHETGVERIQENLLKECEKLLQQITPPVEPPFSPDLKHPIPPIQSITEEESLNDSRQRKTIGNTNL